MQVLDCADGETLAFEDGTLLDMQLYVGGRSKGARLDVAGVADAGQLLAEQGSVHADCRQRLVDGQAPRVDERAHHVGGVTHAFFVGEGCDGDRTMRGEAHVAQRLYDFETGENAIAAIKDAGVDDRVDMRADQDRAVFANAVRPPNAKYVSDPVDRDVEARLAEPSDELVPSKLVGIRSGEPHEPAVRVAADLSERSKAPKKTVRTDGRHDPLRPS